MREIDFLPRNFRRAARLRQTRRRLAVLAGLAMVSLVLHLTYETRVDRALASSSGLSGDRFGDLAATAPLLGPEPANSDKPADLDSRVARAEQAILRLMNNEYQLRCMSFETGNKVGSDATLLHGRIQAVAKSELSVGILMGRLAACPFFKEMHLNELREVREAGRPMREFELTCTLNLDGFSK